MNKIDVQWRINDRITAHIPLIAWKSTVAVVVADRPSVFQIGSATIFQIADMHFVVTAAHVVQRAGEAGKTIGISGGKDDHFIALAGNWMLSSPKGESKIDRYDLAVHHLSQAAVERLCEMRFLRLSEAAFDDPGPRAVFTLFGYPGIWTYPSHSDTDQVSVKPLEYTTYAYDGSLAGIQDYYPRTQLLLSAGAEDLSAPNGQPLEFRDKFGQPARLPVGLKGVSGCSVWHIGDLDVPIEKWAARGPSLAGVVTGVYQGHGAILVTRWIGVTTLINAAFPELRPVLQLQLRP